MSVMEVLLVVVEMSSNYPKKEAFFLKRPLK